MGDAIIGYFINAIGTNLVEYPKTQDEMTIIKNTLKMTDTELKQTKCLTNFYFADLKDKENFVNSYNEAKKELSKYKTRDNKLQCLLNKRHYLVLTLMGYKTNTTVKKEIIGIKPNDHFYIFDQTYFIPCKLIKLTPLANNRFSYDYELVK